MASFANILHSKQFTVFIGPNETPVTVHSGAIEALSAPLERLVNGPFAEAQDNIARFPDITVEDFEMICAFAYGAGIPQRKVDVFDDSTLDIQKDFWVQSPCIWSERSKEIRNNKLTAHVLYSTLGDLNKHPSLNSSESPESFESLDSSDSESPDKVWDNTVDEYHCCGLLDDHTYPSKSGEGPMPIEEIERLQKQEYDGQKLTRWCVWNQDVSGVLVCHARIYVFAEKFLIASLQKEIERVLRKLLLEMDVYRPTRSGVIELIQYCYNEEHIPNRGDEDVIHPVREMVVHFVALHLSAFRDYPPHRELLRCGGDYPLDLQDAIREWLL